MIIVYYVLRSMVNSGLRIWGRRKERRDKTNEAKAPMEEGGGGNN